jgi:hypothetical protein
VEDEWWASEHVTETVMQKELVGKDGDKAIVGEKGVVYGLQIPASSSRRSAAPVKRKAGGIFGDESSEEDELEPVQARDKKHSRGNAANLVVGKMLARQAAAIDNDARVKEFHARALQEDSSIFDYDAHVDAIQEARKEKAQVHVDEKVERKSKYIAGLLETAEHRKKEQEVLFEKRLEKERVAEEQVYGTKEKFVTSAYRKKLEEEEKWKVEQEKKKEEEEANAVEKKGHMGGFYQNYLQAYTGSGLEESGISKNSEPRKSVDIPEDGPTRSIEEEKGEERDAEMAPSGPLPVVESKDKAPVEKLDPVSKAEEQEKEQENAADRAARLKMEREEKIAKAKARYAARRQPRA